eukprot:TRINITY_DN20833_c0_g1_i1.p1 TRINITY_DN20833_c0_g1~~TRINITY_DN20833_c0_g1_i1.p1  ORF type:complete len:281 (+),score=29.89 TRINITY_DN20833_c0_g1_i1:243-1085(+)
MTMLIIAFLSVVSLVARAQDTCDAAHRISMDGDTHAGTLSQNKYSYYCFIPQTWGVVTINTVVTGGSAVGVWSWVGLEFRPVDGRSDYNMGSIANYPANFQIVNAFPNRTYWLGIQGIGISSSFSTSVTIANHPPTPPVDLVLGDPPTTASVEPRQFAFFRARVPSGSPDGPTSHLSREQAPSAVNVTAFVFVQDTSHTTPVDGLGSSTHVSLLLGTIYDPTTVHHDEEVVVPVGGTWVNVTAPWVRTGPDQWVGVSVYGKYASRFFVRVSAVPSYVGVA